MTPDHKASRRRGLGFRADLSWGLPAVMGLALAVVLGARLVRGDAGSPGDTAASPAVERLLANPASARQWLATGRLLLVENEPEKARYCMERSVELAPRSPPVLLEAAAFFYAMGDAPRGLALMARALAETRDYDDVIFALYDRAADVEAVLRQGLPREPSAARSYLRHILKRGDRSGTRVVWDWLASQGFADRALLRRYLLDRIANGFYDEAGEVFEAFLTPGESPPGGNRITHGGFEAESTRAPLDWVVTPVPHATARRDKASAREGSWSLRVEFDGKANTEYRYVRQQAIVSPGRWKLRAWIRTQGLSSEQGVGLRILEANPTPRWQAWTETVSGDSDWKSVEATVVIPPQGRLAQIEIVRRPSRNPDDRVGGVAWVDGVSLVEVRG